MGMLGGWTISNDWLMAKLKANDLLRARIRASFE
jgi:hypothetical protein